MKRFLFLALVSIPIFSLSQSQLKTFYSITGLECDSIDSYYYRIQPVDRPNYTAQTFYTSNNAPYSIERFEQNKLEGLSSFYHPNGQLYYEVNYEKNNPVGLVRKFYTDGKIQVSELYDSTIKENELDIDCYIIDYYDSLGSQLVKSGNGYYHEYVPQENGSQHYFGRIKDGVKDSIWNGLHSDQSFFFKETWNKGKLIMGNSSWQDGTQYEYTKISEVAQPRNGLSNFYQYVGRNLKYPKESRRKGIEGRVFLSFVVDKDGKILDSYVVKGIGGGCDEEALRVINMSPIWIPGKQRGKPVKTRFNLAIIFKLT